MTTQALAKKLNTKIPIPLTDRWRLTATDLSTHAEYIYPDFASQDYSDSDVEKLTLDILDELFPGERSGDWKLEVGMRFGTAGNLWYRAGPDTATRVHKDGLDPVNPRQKVVVGSLGARSARTLVQLNQTPGKPSYHQLTPVNGVSFYDISNVWHSPPAQTGSSDSKTFVRLWITVPSSHL